MEQREYYNYVKTRLCFISFMVVVLCGDGVWCVVVVSGGGVWWWCVVGVCVVVVRGGGAWWWCVLVVVVVVCGGVYLRWCWSLLLLLLLLLWWWWVEGLGGSWLYNKISTTNITTPTQTITSCIKEMK